MMVMAMMAISVPAAGQPQGPERAALLDAARGPAQADLGKPVRFLVKRLERRGEWAFLLADMQNLHGRPIDFAGTRLADAEREGAVSRAYAALLRWSDGRWTVVDHATGPTDVAWEDWAREHGAPAELFAS